VPPLHIELLVRVGVLGAELQALRVPTSTKQLSRESE
jgi:hypothetical protein